MEGGKAGSVRRVRVERRETRMAGETSSAEAVRGSARRSAEMVMVRSACRAVPCMKNALGVVL